MKPTLQEIGDLLKKDRAETDKHYYGQIQSLVTAEDGSVRGYEVSLGPGSDTVFCRKLSGAKIGDTVMVMLLSSGIAVVTGTVGGDGDAADALTKAINIEADYVKASTLDADVARIGFLKADSALIRDLQADAAKIDDIEADYVKASTLDTDVARIGYLKADSSLIQDLQADAAKIEKLDADAAVLRQVQIGKGSATEFSAAKADFTQAIASTFTADQITALRAYFDLVTANRIDATTIGAVIASFEQACVGQFTADEIKAASAAFQKAVVGQLQTGRLDAGYAKLNFANVDTAAITTAWIKDLFIQGGFLAEEGGFFALTGVHISGDLIDANTLRADRLLLQGENGLYYAINVDELGKTTADSDPKYQEGLDGSVILAHSITANEITAQNIQGTGGWINLAQGTFSYVNAQSGHGIIWDGSNLIISTDRMTVGEVDLSQAIQSAIDAAETVETMQEYIDTKADSAEGAAKTYAKACSDEAAKNATSYISEVTSGGIFVHQADTGMAGSQPTDSSAYGVHISDGVDIIRAGVSVANYAEDARVGNAHGSNVYISSEGHVDIRHGTDVATSFRSGEILLGSESGLIQNKITNNRLEFKSGSSALAYFGLNEENLWEMHIENMFADKMVRFGDFAWLKRENGNMSIKWIGGSQ